MTNDLLNDKNWRLNAVKEAEKEAISYCENKYPELDRDSSEFDHLVWEEQKKRIKEKCPEDNWLAQQNLILEAVRLNFEKRWQKKK